MWVNKIKYEHKWCYPYKKTMNNSSAIFVKILLHRCDLFIFKQTLQQMSTKDYNDIHSNG